MDDIFFQIEDNDSNSEEQEITIQQNPNLIEKIIRERIYESVFYKQHCYTAKLTDLLQKASTGNNCIKYVGTTFGGNTKPTPFICFLFRLLHYPQLSLGAVVYCLDRIGSEYKYVRALFALYLRMTLPTVKSGTGVEVYKLLEPLYQDYRKLRRRRMDGSFDLIRMDEYIESLLLLNGKEDFPLALTPLTKREVLEEIGQLEKRVSPLQEEYELLLKSQTDSDDSSLSSSSSSVSSSSDNDDVTPTSNKKKFKLNFKKKIAPVESTKKDVDDESSFENVTFREEMSIEETNIQRAKLGLPPLK
jgi:pre-mRNA-splicing factor 38A